MIKKLYASYVRALLWVTPVITIRQRFRLSGPHHRMPHLVSSFCEFTLYSTYLCFLPVYWAMSWCIYCVNFRATVVQKYELFWVKIPSPVLSQNGALPTSLSPQTTSASMLLPHPVCPATPQVYCDFCNNLYWVVKTACSYFKKCISMIVCSVLNMFEHA